MNEVEARVAAALSELAPIPPPAAVPTLDSIRRRCAHRLRAQSLALTASAVAAVAVVGAVMMFRGWPASTPALTGSTPASTGLESPSMSPPPRVALPAHPDQEAEPLMGVDGILRGDASTMCVWQESSTNPAERIPILWPPSYTVARDGADLVVYNAAGAAVIRTGQYLSANGGLARVQVPEDPCMLGAARAVSVFSPTVGSAPHPAGPSP